MHKTNPITEYLERGRHLKQRLAAHEPLLGVFIKSTDPAVVEILAQTAVDFLILDTEHRAFSADATAAAIMAARNYLMPLLIRIPDHAASTISTVLDQGALGIVAPGISSHSEAQAVIRASRYLAGERGFSPSVAANGYGVLSADEFKQKSDDAITVLAQIETLAGYSSAQEIVSSDNLDGVFIGPVDLAHALSKAPAPVPNLDDAVSKIVQICKQENRTIGIFSPSADIFDGPVDGAMSFFVISTDFALLRGAASGVAKRFHEFHKSSNE